MDADAVVSALRDHGVVVAWLFGSVAAGTASTDSDVDIAVLRDGPLGLLEASRLSRSLEPLAGGPVDLVDFLRAPLPLQARIVRTGHVLFSDDEARRVAEAVRVQGMWPDVERSLAEMDRAFLARIAAGRLGDG